MKTKMYVYKSEELGDICVKVRKEKDSYIIDSYYKILYNGKKFSPLKVTKDEILDLIINSKLQVIK